MCGCAFGHADTVAVLCHRMLGMASTAATTAFATRGVFGGLLGQYWEGHQDACQHKVDAAATQTEYFCHHFYWTPCMNLCCMYMGTLEAGHRAKRSLRGTPPLQPYMHLSQTEPRATKVMHIQWGLLRCGSIFVAAVRSRPACTDLILIHDPREGIRDHHSIAYK